MAANSTSFKKGDNRPRKPKGAVSEKTRFWNELSDFVTNEGANKYQQELLSLEGKDFIQAYQNILEFFKPKLARQDITAEVTHPQNEIDLSKLTPDEISLLIPIIEKSKLNPDDTEH